MKKISTLLIIFLISGCTVTRNQQEYANLFCKQHEGINHIYIDIIVSEVVCNDNTRYNIKLKENI